MFSLSKVPKFFLDNVYFEKGSRLQQKYEKLPSIQRVKGDSNPNDKYVLSERALWTMNFDTSIIKIGWKWGSYGHLKNSISPTFSRHFEYLISFQNFFNCSIFSYQYYHSICVSADMQLYT